MVIADGWPMAAFEVLFDDAPPTDIRLLAKVCVGFGLTERSSHDDIKVIISKVHSQLERAQDFLGEKRDEEGKREVAQLRSNVSGLFWVSRQIDCEPRCAKNEAEFRERLSRVLVEGYLEDHERVLHEQFEKEHAKLEAERWSSVRRRDVMEIVHELEKLERDFDANCRELREKYLSHRQVDEQREGVSDFVFAQRCKSKQQMELLRSSIAASSAAAAAAAFSPAA